MFNIMKKIMNKILNTFSITNYMTPTGMIPM